MSQISSDATHPSSDDQSTELSLQQLQAMIEQKTKECQQLSQDLFELEKKSEVVRSKRDLQAKKVAQSNSIYQYLLLLSAIIYALYVLFSKKP